MCETPYRLQLKFHFASNVDLIDLFAIWEDGAVLLCQSSLWK